nr:YafY family protein [uncultured Gellertiella sp.]
MARARRLLDLLQLLRSHRYPVAGQVLADTLGVSLRTVYRDIATLQGEGADIEGEPGIGYVLRPGFMLPPLMFTREEIEALVLGSRWVARRTDDALAHAAGQALAKITAVLPEEMRDHLASTHLLIGPAPSPRAGKIDLAPIRAAIRQEKILHLGYRDEGGNLTERDIWPFALGFFEQVRVVIAWCVLRSSFRHFRTDRIEQLEVRAERYPRHRQSLLKAWRQENDINDKIF